MKIMITGADGQVGRELVLRVEAAGQESLALDRTGLDITDAHAVRRVLADSGAGLVINAAAYTAVDKAEQEADLAFAVNRDGSSHLAVACKEFDIPLLHISTDYVFDGNQAGGYRENDPIAPLGVYGHSKWQGEEAIRQVLESHIILRVSWVFGCHGQNFVKTMCRLAREREELRVVADQYGCPTPARDIADVLWVLAQRFATRSTLPWGTYHYCGTPAISWHGFACAIIDSARRREPLNVQKITPITSAEFPTPAARPANSVLDCTKLGHLGIMQKPWQIGLEQVLASF